ncbi:MAG: T9SS type A sorting domain-containing protein, partial [Bacteroidia bacterium]
TSSETRLGVVNLPIVCTIPTVSIASQNNVLCNGGTTGAATIHATGTAPFTYSWSNGGTDSIATTLNAGIYTCIVTNACGADTQTVTITQPSAITASTNSNEPTCNGDTNGTAKVTVSGGTAPYSYSWSFGGSTTNIATGLIAGTYTCTITDSNMCTLTKNITVVDFPVLTATVAQANVLCNGANTGAASVVAIGGDVSYYDYLWSNGSTNDSIVNIGAGAYTCTITDDNGCAIVQAITVTQAAAITSAQTLTLCAGQSTTVGTNTYSTSGTYTDVLTATNGCDSTVTTNLTVESAIDITTTLSGLAITANQTGATYQWIDCANNTPIANATNATYTATANGNYAAIVTVNNCVDTTACVSITSVGIKALNITNANINLYPNPSNGVFTIELNANGSVIIMDVLGKVIINQNVTKGKNTIDLSAYSNGVYVLSVT